MKNIFLKHWEIWTLLAFTIVIVWPLFLPGYFSHHDDLQVMRIFEMRRCLLDLQIPCRWVPDMGYGNGFPVFNYYGVLPYYIGAFLSFGLGYIGAAKALFFIPLVLGGISMYLLGKELFGKLAGFTAGALFLYAPYRALDTYVRGAIDESFALAIVPLIFYFILKLGKLHSLKNFIGLAVMLGLFLISHNIMTMIFVPIVLLWTLYILYKEGTGNLAPVFFALLLGFGLAAFFIVPAFVEKSLVQTDTLTRLDLDYRAHFATVDQLLFSHFWGYGASVPGPNDTISFQVGWPHWWLAAVTVLSAVFALSGKRFFPKKKILLESGNIGLVFILFYAFTFSLLMAHNRSAFIWEKIDLLRFTQFPWRFLSLSIFSASLLGGASLIFIKDKKAKVILSVAILATTVILNWSFFKPEIFYYSMNDAEKLSGSQWEMQRKASILDYLPKTAQEPKEPAPANPIVVSGEAAIDNFNNRTNNWHFFTKVEKKAKIEVPVFDFPDWQVEVGSKEYPHSHDNYLGRITFTLDPGSYEVRGRLHDTFIRSFANMVSLMSVVVLLSLLFYGKVKRNLT